eukprot:1160224-Pelagomonas_calceolata.AAC.7
MQYWHAHQGWPAKLLLNLGSFKGRQAWAGQCFVLHALSTPLAAPFLLLQLQCAACAAYIGQCFVLHALSIPLAAPSVNTRATDHGASCVAHLHFAHIIMCLVVFCYTERGTQTLAHSTLSASTTGPPPDHDARESVCVCVCEGSKGGNTWRTSTTQEPCTRNARSMQGWAPYLTVAREDVGSLYLPDRGQRVRGELAELSHQGAVGGGQHGWASELRHGGCGKGAEAGQGPSLGQGLQPA